MFEKMFGYVGVGQGKEKHSEQVYRGEAGLEKPKTSTTSVMDNGERKLGGVPGRVLDPVRAEQVHRGEAAQIENGVKKKELREKIEFLSSQIDRYIAQLATLKGEHAPEEKTKSLEEGIKHGMDLQKKLEQELVDLG